MKSEKPGQFPFTRGIYPEMYIKRLWTMRQYAGFTSAEASNKRYQYLLKNGVAGLSVAFDLPTQIGYDSDHPISVGEVGKAGVPISSLQNMETLFRDIPLDQVSTSMTINATAATLLAFYVASAENQGIPVEKLKGTIQNDILKEYAARGTFIYPPLASMRLVTDIFDFCASHIPRWNTISISGYHIREAGSTAVQELAFTFANGIAYVQAAIDQGLDPNEFGSRISFFFNAHNGFLEEIAKFRAAREIWANIMKKRFGVTNEKALLCRFHVQTGGSTLTASQIDNNVVRTTIQALSAVLGGTQSLHTNSRDEALALPTDEAVKLALRTQQIIAHESGIPNHPDPFGGSYVIEELTNDFVKDSMKIIENIDGMGGAVSAIEKGWIQNEIARSAYEYQKEVDSKKRIIVGVNQFDEKEDIEPDILEIDANKVKKQVESLIILKESRNNDQVKNQLTQLKTIAQSNDNVIPSLISCAKNDCTLGEISDTLRNVFGEH
ncbi:MAG: methylmalonyl-CoA mutase family protein [Candidatus Neomarinimicrobiota bacterium]|nr:methylmalonyl-CoA mutase family protein [Candidatus Neomarinimicrobiota bacterium]